MTVQRGQDLLAAATPSGRGWGGLLRAGGGRLVFTLTCLALAILFAYGASLMAGRPGRFPFAVAVITIGVCVLELIGQARSVRADPDAAPGADATPAGEPLPTRRREVAIVVAWFVGTIVGVYAAGVLVAAFLSTGTYYKCVDGQRTATAVLAGALLTGSIWVIFDVLAGFTLYRGVIW